ncbi:hypothetical protein CC80DRAFT_441677 [Byssothecium circinans]|uniref:Uncharacterized protein n=1 Tax=Byssothecium circinans TaxID=147558 RepID=A0A6A5U177_9PLEO|nr:hypothetical protein CC80DRAFT_441677 [Byssothecium circinans]
MNCDPSPLLVYSNSKARKSTIVQEYFLLQLNQFPEYIMIPLILLILAILSPTATSSPLNSTSTITPSLAEPTCWIPMLRKPGLERDCTFYETTRTRTVYTDCGGCGLSTRMLGHGLVSLDILDGMERVGLLMACAAVFENYYGSWGCGYDGDGLFDGCGYGCGGGGALVA